MPPCPTTPSAWRTRRCSPCRPRAASPCSADGHHFSSRRPLLTECPTTQGGFAAHPAPLRSAGLLLPPGPPCFSSRRPLLTECPPTQGGFAHPLPPPRPPRLLLPPRPPL